MSSILLTALSFAALIAVSAASANATVVVNNATGTTISNEDIVCEEAEAQLAELQSIRKTVRDEKRLASQQLGSRLSDASRSAFSSQLRPADRIQVMRARQAAWFETRENRRSVRSLRQELRQIDRLIAEAKAACK